MPSSEPTPDSNTPTRFCLLELPRCNHGCSGGNGHPRPHSEASDARGTHLRRRPHFSDRRRRRVVLRCVGDRAPADALLHHADGPVRRPEEEVDRPGLREHVAGPEDLGGSDRRSDRRCRREPGRRRHGANAGRRAPPGRPTAQLQGCWRRHFSDGEAGRRGEPVARVEPDREQGDDSDGVAVGVIRPVQGDDTGEWPDEGRAGDPRNGELRSRVRGVGGVEPGGRDKDEGDEHEGGARAGAAV